MTAQVIDDVDFRTRSGHSQAATDHVQLGKRLQEKRYFIRFGMVAFGVPLTVAELWMFGGYGGPGFWILIVVASILAAWGWAHGMWWFCKDDLQKTANRDAESG